MREITAYFMIEQIQNPLPGIRKKAADQHGWCHFDILPLILPIAITTLLDHTLSIFVVFQFHINRPMELIFQTCPQSHGQSVIARTFADHDEKTIFVILLIGFYSQILVQWQAGVLVLDVFDTVVFSDFLCRLLLYVTGSNIPNTTGQSFIGSINKEIILNPRNFYQNEYQWNDEQQTLVLIFKKVFDIFEQALHTYAVKDFIENIDPTNRLDITYVEKSEAFIQYIQSNLHMLFEPSALENPGFTVQKLQEFIKTLDDYTIYLGKNMRLLDPAVSTDLFVPIYRNENSKAELAFAEKTFAYRKQLVSIYQEICEHMMANKIPFLSKDTKCSS